MTNLRKTNITNRWGIKQKGIVKRIIIVAEYEIDELIVTLHNNIRHVQDTYIKVTYRVVCIGKCTISRVILF